MILAYHGQNYVYVMLPVTVSKDTPFHLAVYSERREPLQGLLDIVNRNPTLGNPLTKKNTYGNTVLHEAVVAGNMEAVKLLLQTVPREQGEFHPSEQLQARNKLGETTLYRAASCGDKEMVEYLAKLPGQISYGKLLEDHRKRGDLTPILHAAILGQHFGFVLNLYLSQMKLLRHLQTRMLHTFK
jgi:ankyrin repeat protein